VTFRCNLTPHWRTGTQYKASTAPWAAAAGGQTSAHNTRDARKWRVKLCLHTPT
jgi:hypothetical protein